jgi:hypothetical protein
MRRKPIIRARRTGNKIGWYFHDPEMKFWSTDLAYLMNYLCTVYRW